MNRFNLVVLLAFVSGCNGEDFTTFSQSSLDAPDASPGSTGGAPSTSTGGASSATGGAPEAGSGGVSQGTGGSSHNTGGSFQETGGSSQTGGSPSTIVDAGCALVTHDTGAGQTWKDCAPIDTYDAVEAIKACETWCEASGGCGGPCNSGSFFCRSTGITVHPSAHSVDGITLGWSGTGDVVQYTAGSCTVIGTWH